MLTRPVVENAMLRMLNYAKRRKNYVWDTYSSLDELAVKIRNMNLPTGVQRIKQEHQYLIYLNITNEGEPNEGEPQIKYH